MPQTYSRLSFFSSLCALVACSTVGSNAPLQAEINSSGETYATNGVLCHYTNHTPSTQATQPYASQSEWACDAANRTLNANGIPDHLVGQFPNQHNPNKIQEQNISASLPIAPAHTGRATQLGGPRGTTGYVLNGVKIDADTAGTCDDTGELCSMRGHTGQWRIEALGHSSFDFGTDANNAHVQPDGTYHYHGIPEGFLTKRLQTLGGQDKQMVLIGWAADGFPIYARYGYSDANDAQSPLKALRGSFQKVTQTRSERPSVDTYPLGTFKQDWQYVAGSGDLDECNGRVGVTPEFPNGIYHYYATDSYPYFQRCVKGYVAQSAQKSAQHRRPPPPQHGHPRPF